MASNKRYYWIKLKDDFLNGDVVDFLMAQKNGAQYVVLYLMLCMNTKNNEGKLYASVGEMIIPYDAEKIVRDTKYFDIDTVTVAMALYKKLGLIYEESGGYLAISNYDELVGSETYNAIHMRQKRKGHNNVMPMLSNCYVEKEIDIDKEKEKDIDKDIDIEKRRERVNYQLVVDMYNDTCVSFPKLRQLSDSRRKAIKARLKSYDYDDFKTLFEKAESSTFLKGGNSRNWSANFDWLIKDANMAKVLDGNYDDFEHDEIIENKPEVSEVTSQELTSLINSMKNNGGF